MFPCYYMYSDVCNESTTLYCITCIVENDNYLIHHVTALVREKYSMKVLKLNCIIPQHFF